MSDVGDSLPSSAVRHAPDGLFGLTNLGRQFAFVYTHLP